MERVSGIGGRFFRGRDPKSVCALLVLVWESPLSWPEAPNVRNRRPLSDA
jgi:hypothetical protein